MSDLLAARSQMAVSLGFHIIFAIVGIGMPLLMVVAERRWLVTRDPLYLELAKRWAKGTAIMFAVGVQCGHFSLRPMMAVPRKFAPSERPTPTP